MLTLTTKTRARSLQRAAQAMFGMNVKLSQAYELIAQMEGYPNWDTAKARFEAPASIASNSVPAYISIKANELWDPHDGDLEQLFASNAKLAANPQLAALLENITLVPPSLILITGKPGSGRSRLARALMRHFSKNLKVVNARSTDDSETAVSIVKQALRMNPDLIYSGELSSEARLISACDAVRTGTNTIATACWERYNASLLAFPARMHTPEALRALDSIPATRIHIED